MSRSAADPRLDLGYTRSMPSQDVSGPAWLGIGSMRSGTTWFTRLLCQHPRVALGINGKKEQWLLNQVASGTRTAEEYRRIFPSDGLMRGEWSPRYMWLLHTATAAVRCIPETSPVLVIMRDPIERFASHQRYAAQSTLRVVAKDVQRHRWASAASSDCMQINWRPGEQPWVRTV